MIKNILNLGDAALYCDFGQEINKETNSNVIKYFNKIRQLKIESINNITPSYNKLIVSFDLNKIKYNELKNLIQKIQVDGEDSFNKKVIEIPICCEEPYSLDFARIEEKLKFNHGQILKNFFKKKYFCYMTVIFTIINFIGFCGDYL